MSEIKGSAAKLVADPLMGDVRDALLTHVRAMETPWSKLPASEQQSRISAVTKLAETLVDAAVEIVGSVGLPHMVITVGKFTCDGAEMKGTYTAYASDENLIRARHLSDQRAVFVLASADAFHGERSPAKPDPDQNELIDEAA